ncbi:MAG: TraB/GumN family protein [Salaquimonas sp.]
MIDTASFISTIDRRTNAILAVACSAMAFMFISFVWVLSQASMANAQQASSPVCKGQDLIALYRANEPEKLAAIETEAAKTIHGESIFWKIEKEGIPASYLLGTMHMADERIANLDENQVSAFETTQTVIVENIEALDPNGASAAMLEYQHMTLYTDGTTLADRLDEATLAKLKIATEDRGIPFAIAQIMQPWLVATSVALPSCELSAKQSGAPVLDGLIAERAKASGKNLVGLETIGEQFSAMYGLPEEFHLNALKETLEMGNLAEDVIETMKLLYLNGEIGMIQPLTKVVSPKTSESESFEDFNTRLITDRNKVMAERSLPHLEKGSVFIAVGALHLPGEKGLVEEFTKAGYKLSAVPKT